MPELMTLPELPPPHLTSFGWDRTAPFQTSQFWALNTLLVGEDCPCCGVFPGLANLILTQCACGETGGRSREFEL